MSDAYPSEELPYGLYEFLDSTTNQLRPIPPSAAWTRGEVEAADQARVLALYVAQRLEHHLGQKATAAERVSIVNDVLAALDPSDRVDLTGNELNQLVALLPQGADQPRRPRTPLNDVALLTNSPKEPSLVREIARELESADRVDLLISFLKVSGVNLLRPALTRIRDRGIPFRVLTTTYMGATDAKAIRILAEEFGAEIKISYHQASTRLHAKAWIFERDSGFTTAYVGSSNLSAAAMTEGLEWNVRLSAALTPGLLNQLRAAFESYWRGRDFQAFKPGDEERLRVSLAEARSGGTSATLSLATIDTSFLDVHARPHQALMLDELAVERARGHHRNLVVAATGTGKTILAALDYQDLRDRAGGDLSLLFVAHRQEILSQARHAYAAVMRNRNFGEFLVGGNRPARWHHVFASVQSLANSLDDVKRVEWDVVVVDEFHHAHAPTYRTLLRSLKPRELLGLTATPERGDSINVADEFFGGRIATELRLWDALDADLLVPFHYFGVGDGTDLRAVPVRSGMYDTGRLESIYVDGPRANARVRVIFDELAERVADPKTMRALGFCASIRHAEFMAAAFCRAEIEAVALTGESDGNVRESALGRLQDPADPLAIIFTVDIFNEGVDIPEVDTILMLRPTQSVTVFQQQLGRGLRRSRGKAVLTVLDFVGNQASGFRMEAKYRAFTRHGWLRPADIDEDFPDTPPGCSIQLDAVTKSEVIRSIKEAVALPVPRLASRVEEFLADRIARFGGTSHDHMGAFLDETGAQLADIYGRGAPTRSRLRPTWTALASGAYRTGMSESEAGFDSRATHINNRIRSLAHVNDSVRRDAYLVLLRGSSREADMSVRERRLAWMLVFSVWPQGRFGTGQPRFSLDEALAELRRHRFVSDELEQVWNIVIDADRHSFSPVPGLGGDCPLLVHASYSREELFAGLGIHESRRGVPGAAIEGVLEAEQAQVIALLVTLEKTEKQYSPQTMYKDYALTEREFAWDSQNVTTPESRRGRLYRQLEPGWTPVLFVRGRKNGDIGVQPYTFLGEVSYVSHEGSQPMHVRWELARPMPADIYAVARVAA